MKIEARPLELEQEIGKVIDFLNLSPEEQVELKDKIEKANGQVRLFVHPNFEKYAKDEDEEKKKERAIRVEKGFQRLLKSSDKKKLPIFIFVSAADKKDFEEKIKDLERKVKPVDEIYYVRTQFANPTPLDPYHNDSYQWMSFSLKRKIGDSDLMWEMTTDQLEDVGVKQILIGGAELYADEDSDIYSGCLGAAVDNLKERFQIKYSRMTWPDKF